MTPTNVPVGAILMYAADSTYQLQEKNWMLCDGSTLNQKDFTDLWNVIGYSNGGSGDLFQLPDLQGRFLRGSTAEKAPGTTADFTTKNPPFKVSLDNIPTSSNKADTGASGPASRQMIRWKSGSSSSFNVEGGDKETRPVNMYVNFIIKTRADNNPLPPASIIPYAGSDDSPVAPDPTTWLACDGNQYSAAQYKDLNDAMGHRFTSTTSKSHFNVPLIRGFFLRGVDPHGARDPDVGTREPAPDGARGAHVGTMQVCATSARGLKVSIVHYPSDNVEVFPTAGRHNLEDARYDSAQAWSGGAAESRPVNAAVQFYISNGHAPTAPDNADPFPLGAIVAVPGPATLPADWWLPADGSELPVNDFTDLHEVLQNAWDTAASSSSPEKFRLPDLRGRFLRATDLSLKDAPDDAKWGDPDRKSRTNGEGTGSLQDCATALPRNPFSIKANNPHSNRQTAATAVGYDVAAFCGSSSFEVTGGDDETAPAHLYVNFWIKVRRVTV